MEHENKNLPVNIPKVEKPKLGRPTTFDQGKADIICELTLTTDWGLRKICSAAGALYSEVRGWMGSNDVFSSQYAKSKMAQMDILGEDIISIADEEVEKNDMAAVQRAKNRIDARKWVMGRLAPDRWGDKVAVAVVEQPKILSESQFEQLLGKMVVGNVEKVEERDKQNDEYTSFEEVE